MRIRATVAVACVLLLTACGTTTSQRVASGGVAGAGIGALVGGPIGAVIGGGVGAVAGWVTPKSADDLAVAGLVVVDPAYGRNQVMSGVAFQQETTGSGISRNLTAVWH